MEMSKEELEQKLKKFFKDLEVFDQGDFSIKIPCQELRSWWVKVPKEIAEREDFENFISFLLSLKKGKSLKKEKVMNFYVFLKTLGVLE